MFSILGEALHTIGVDLRTAISGLPSMPTSLPGLNRVIRKIEVAMSAQGFRNWSIRMSFEDALEELYNHDC
jgi:hypothetical protein